MNVTDPLINPLIFTSFCYREFCVTKSLVMEIQHLIVNSRSRPVKSDSKEYQCLFKYVSSKKSMTRFFKLIKELCCGYFCAKGNFPKNWLHITAVVPQHLDVKNRVE